MSRISKFIRLMINNKRTVIYIISTIAVFVIISCVTFVLVFKGNQDTTAVNSDEATEITGSDFTYISPAPEDVDPATVTDAPEPVIDKEVTSFVPSDKMDLEPTSITVYVNKEHALPKDYKPDDLVIPNIHFNLLTYDERTMLRAEAAKAIEKLFAAAEKDNCHLAGVSGYRSYARQYKIFTNNIATQGKEHTLQYSAVPGTSEHQTGLSMDVSTKSQNYQLSDKFADSDEGKWLAENAYKYGFIIRYPKDKADITGYAFEPWHIRYVGRGLSYYLYKNKLTLDEYYHYTPNPNFDFETVYADIINYVAPTVTIAISPSPSITVIPVTPTKAPDDNDTPGSGNDTDNPGKDNEATPVPTPTKAPQVTDIPSGDDNGSETSGDNVSVTPTIAPPA